MANPRVEDGHLKIADGLTAALYRNNFTSHMLRVVLAVMDMTYRAGKTKSQISVYDLVHVTGLKRYYVEQALDRLIQGDVVFKQELANGTFLLGIQKDFDKWLLKMSKSKQFLKDNMSREQPIRSIGLAQNEQNDPVLAFLTEIQKRLGIVYSQLAWRAERGKAKKLYTLALDITHSPLDAYAALLDYFEEVCDERFRAKVTRPMAWMLAGFEQWLRNTPSKTPEIRLQEEVTEYRWRYNHTKRNWEQTDERLGTLAFTA